MAEGRASSIFVRRCRSSNTDFFDLGARLGPESMASVARAFGLGTNRSVDVFGARPGLVPDGGWKQKGPGRAVVSRGLSKLRDRPGRALQRRSSSRRWRPPWPIAAALYGPVFSWPATRGSRSSRRRALPLLDQFSQADYAGGLKRWKRWSIEGISALERMGRLGPTLGRTSPTAWPGSPARLRWWKSPGRGIRRRSARRAPA